MCIRDSLVGSGGSVPFQVNVACFPEAVLADNQLRFFRVCVSVIGEHKSITNHKWADKFISAFSKQFDMHVIQDNQTFKDIVIDDELSSFSNRYADVESTI